jgi:hypothetical protein
MKNIAGNIIRRLLVVTVFLGCSAVVCCGVASNTNAKAVVCNIKNCACSEKNVEDMRPSQLVSIRIMQLL